MLYRAFVISLNGITYEVTSGLVLTDVRYMIPARWEAHDYYYNSLWNSHSPVARERPFKVRDEKG